MRYLLILDAALCALAATMAVCLGVVWLMYSFHADLSSRVSLEMPTVATTVIAFALMAIALGAAFWAVLKETRWKWWAQGAAATTVSLASMFLYELFSA